MLGAQPGWAQVLVGVRVRREGSQTRGRRVLGAPDLAGGCRLLHAQCRGLCKTSALPENLFVLERRGRDEPAYCLGAPLMLEFPEEVGDGRL